MKYAKFIKKMEDWKGNAAVYELSEPLNNFKYVIVSAVDFRKTLSSIPSRFFGRYMHSKETLIFPSDKEGNVVNWEELGGLRGICNHEKVLEEMGYTIA